MYQIKEFSYLCKTTIKTLRHYEKVGVLLPKEINSLTGYRFYEESQVETFQQIKTLQEAGFTLKEIKDILYSTKESQLNQQILDMISDYNDRLKKLQELKDSLREETKIELIPNSNFIMIGKYKRLKSRDDYDKEFAKIDKKIGIYRNVSKKALECYTPGYQEENFLCFIGRAVKDDYKEIHNVAALTSRMKRVGLDILIDDRPPTMLHIHTKGSVSDAYQKLIQYADQNQIQLRGSFKEVYNEDNLDIYIEAYDLTKENPDRTKFETDLKKKLASTEPQYDKELIGKWKLLGEQLEPTKFYNPEKSQFIPDTELKEIEFRPNGTTNFSNITWRDRYMIIKKGEYDIYCSIGVMKRKRKRYLTVLLNTEKSASRPIRLFYKKEKNKGGIL